MSSAAPLPLVFAPKRRVRCAHSGEVTSVVLDGEYALTASRDGEVRVWDAHSGAVQRAFASTTQRLAAHAGGVTALARVADGYVVSGSADGACAVWTRHPEAAPLHPSHDRGDAPDRPGGDAGESSAENAGESPASDTEKPSETAETPPEETEPPPPPPPDLVSDPALDPDEAGITRELRELRLGRDAALAAIASYDGPYARVGAFRVNGARGAKVVAIEPLHHHPYDDSTGASLAPDPDPATGVLAPPDASVPPERVAVALASVGGSDPGAHCVRIFDVFDAFDVEQDLPHPESVTAMLRRVDPKDGRDWIVTGCLDGRVRVWGADPPPWRGPPSADDEEEGGEEGVSGGGDDSSGGGKENVGPLANTRGDETGDPSLPTKKRRAKKKPPRSAFVLEATLDGHGGRAVTSLAWLDDHPNFPAPYRPPRRPPRAFGDDEQTEEEEEKEPPARWPGKDARMHFLSGGADGGVRLWERTRAPEEDAKETEDETEDEAGEHTYVWAAEFREPEVSDAPAAPRIEREFLRRVRAGERPAPLASTLDGVGVRSLGVFSKSVVAGMSDGRVAVWGHRTRDASGEPGWCLEKVHDAPGGSASAIVTLAACGWNMLACSADGTARVWA